MDSFMVFSLCLIICSICTCFGAKYRDPACDPGDPFPIGNIDLTKVQGTWYLQYIKPPKGFPISSVLTSFRLIIDPPLQNDSSTGKLSGRSMDTCGCVESDFFFNATGRKNSYLEISALTEAAGVQTEWRFLDIYKDYLLTMACIQFDKFNRCERSFVEIFSRNDNPIPLPALKRLNQSARKTLCVDIFESLFEWPFGNSYED